MIKLKQLKKYKFSIIVALIILYLSLANSHTFDKVTFLDSRYTDKIVHFSMYFGFMSVIILENRKKLVKSGRLLILALIPLFYGILMEIFQGLFTSTRSPSIYDVIFNCTGIVASILIWQLVKSKMSEGVVK
jgi:VanZ family protein